jgi:hypothetical protein
VGEEFGEADEDRGLAGTDTADEDVRPPPLAILEVAHDDAAQVVASHDLRHRGGTLDELRGLLPCKRQIAIAHAVDPPQHQPCVRHGQRQHRHDEAAEDPTRERAIVAAAELEPPRTAEDGGHREHDQDADKHGDDGGHGGQRVGPAATGSAMVPSRVRPRRSPRPRRAARRGGLSAPSPPACARVLSPASRG